MVGSDSWVYQGRQYHMWFGHGTKPKDASLGSAPQDVLPPLQDRIHSVGHTLVAGLPRSKRHHAAARLSVADHGHLDRLLTGVAHAHPLGPRLVPLRVLGRNADAPGIGAFVKAGAVIRTASTNADLREATDLVARSAQDMGLDRFKPFLREADDHLARTGGMLALLREVPRPAMPAVSPPPGQLGPLLRGALRGTGLLGIAAGLLDAYTRGEEERQTRAVIERFGLDPSNPADAAAALAFRWAQTRGPWLFDTPQTGPEMQAMAERVMRAARADPTLLGRALAGDAASVASLKAVAQGAAMPGSGIETRDDEERSLVAQMISEGKSGAEIQAALDGLRNRGGASSASRQRPELNGLNGPEKPNPEWLKGQTYEGASYHGQTSQVGPRGVKSAAPQDGMAALRNSYKVSENAPRRIAVDAANKQFVVLDRTSEGLWHGHVRTWDNLTQGMRNALIRNGVTTSRGKVI